MDFWKTILVVFRRWYIALPVFLLVFVVAAAVYISRPVQYTSYSVLVLTAPTSGATQRGRLSHAPYLTNPLLNFDQGLNNTAALLVQALTTPEKFNQLGVSRDGDPTFQVTNGSSNPELLINGPLVVITAQGTSPGKAQDLVVHVMQRARQELVYRQQELKAPPSTYIVASEVVPPTTPQEQRSTRLRPAVSAFGLGCIASVAAVFGAESFLTRSGRRRPQSRASDRTAAITIPDSEMEDSGTRFLQHGPSTVATSPSSHSTVSDDEQHE